MTILVRQNIYAAFLDGEATAMEALRSLCNDYDEIESSYKDFERIRESVREQIGNVLLRLDGSRAIVDGFGVLMLTSPGVSIKYDKAKLRELIIELVDEGNEAMAERIEACQERKERVGGLRIERAR